MHTMTPLLAEQRIHDMHRQAERARLVRTVTTRNGRRSRPSTRGN